MNKNVLAAGAAFGLTAVALGAFGAHLLKSVLSPENVATFETGVRYQFYHALLLLFIGSGIGLRKAVMKAAAWLVSIGTVLFSGSIYLLATNNLTAFDFRIIGIVTPIGGTLLIIAWLLLFIDFIKKKS